MSAGPPIPVMGLGVVSALGTRPAQLLEHLHQGTAPTRPVARDRGWHRIHGAALAAQVHEPDRQWRPAGVVLRRLSRPSRFAVAAAFQALGAGTVGEEPDPGLGVSMATMFGPSDFTEKIMDQTLDHGPAAVSPSLFTECVANAAAAQVSLKTLARGPNLTVMAREAGPACALIQALTVLRRGHATRMLAGSAEEITPFLHSRLDRFRVLARAAPSLPEAARPFDRRRNGVLAAEGSTLLLLHAVAEAGPGERSPLAWILGGRMAFDATAGRNGWGRGSDSLAAALVELLEQTGVPPGSIDLIVSGAGGSRQGDRLEAAILRRAWGNLPLPPVLAPKGITGEFGGAFLAAAVLAAVGEYRGTPVSDFVADDELGITPHAGASLEAPHRTLISAPATGGGYGWLLLQRQAP